MASASKPWVMVWQYFPGSLPSCSVKSSALKEPRRSGALILRYPQRVMEAPIHPSMRTYCCYHL